jgi:hypothetical protein
MGIAASILKGVGGVARGVGGQGSKDESPMGKIAGAIKGRRAKRKPEPPEGQEGDAQVGYKRGGPVRKTGLALVHKGEHVLTKKQAKRMRKE